MFEFTDTRYTHMPFVSPDADAMREAFASVEP